MRISSHKSGAEQHVVKTFLRMALASCLIGACGLPTTSAAADSVRDQSPKPKTVHASSDEPLWRVDLQSIGYPASELASKSRRNAESFRTVDFLTQDVVAATFITREPEPELPKRDDPNRPRRDVLHAIFMDAATGKVLKTMEWPTDDAGAGIFPRYDGSFLYSSTERIVLYSADWLPVKELVLPQLQAPHITLTGISESPSGKTLELRIAGENSAVCIRIDTSTLNGVQEKCITESGHYSISDDAIAQADLEDLIKAMILSKSGQPIPTNSVAPFKSKIMIRERNSDAHLLCDQNHVPGCSNPLFVDNQTIVVYGLTGFSVLARKAESKDQAFEKVFTSGSVWVDVLGAGVRPSPNGHRFAVVINEPPETVSSASSLNLFSSMPDQIVVYDVPAGGFVFTLKNKKKQFQKISGMAFSPSGEKLSIDSGGVIQMYALPTAYGATIVAH